MKNIVIFASGFGSNFQALLDATKDGRLHGKIVGLICDKPGAYAMERARIHSIPVALFERHSFASKHDMDVAILNQCQDWKADWLVLAGYMRLLSPMLIQGISATHRQYSSIPVTEVSRIGCGGSGIGSKGIDLRFDDSLCG
jgi:phosphoribosylglycinamide formyltransferase 1